MGDGEDFFVWEEVVLLCVFKFRGMVLINSDLNCEWFFYWIVGFG